MLRYILISRLFPLIQVHAMKGLSINNLYSQVVENIC